MSSPSPAGRRRLERAIAGAAFVLGLPGTLGLLTGVAPRDWAVPFGPQHLGDFALRTVIYLSGFLASFGAIGLAWTLSPAAERPEHGEAAPEQERDRTSTPGAGAGAGTGPGVPPGDAGAPVSPAEPLYGFLPRAAQERIAKATGYQPLLYTKISILLSGAVGVLLAGSYEFTGELEPVPAAGAVRIAIGLYLMAESVQRYIRFARREPSGTLIGWLVHAVASGLGPRPKG